MLSALTFNANRHMNTTQHMTTRRELLVGAALYCGGYVSSTGFGQADYAALSEADKALAYQLSNTLMQTCPMRELARAFAQDIVDCYIAYQCNRAANTINTIAL